MLAMLLIAGTETSFALASELLESLAGLTISPKQVERRTLAIGTERCAERDAAVDAYHAQTLVERKGVPSGVIPPALAVVQMDGGRLQIFDRALPSLYRTLFELKVSADAENFLLPQRDPTGFALSSTNSRSPGYVQKCCPML